MSNVISFASGNPSSDTDPEDGFELLALCSAAMVIFDASGAFVWWNKSAREELLPLFPQAPQGLTLNNVAQLSVSLDQNLEIATTEVAGEKLQAITFPSLTSQEAPAAADRQLSAIEEIELQAEALVDGSQAQSFVLDVMDSSVRRLQDALLDITSQAAVAQERANQSMTAAARGQESLSESLKTMEFMGASSRQIERLAEILQSVAKQTSLLALNAAIEAARVGEDGRGFAVIAEEVRNLSTKAKGAVQEVSALVGQTDTWIEEGLKLSQLVDGGLQEISETATATLAEVANIVTAVEEQAVGASNTYKAVHEVIDLAETNSVSADEILACGKALKLLTSGSPTNPPTP